MPWMAIDWSRHVREVRIDTHRVRYVDYGDGPAVVLVHGMAGSWESWLMNITALAREHRVIAVDLPGFGGSDPLPEGSQFDAYARILAALLDELAIVDAAVVGHSLGGLASLTLAASAPDRIGCVVLVAGGGVELSFVRLKAIQAAFLLLRIAMILPGVARALRTPRVGRLVLGPIVHDPRAVPDEVVSAVMPRSVGAGFLDAVRLAGRWLAELDLRTVAAPVLLVWGRKDRVLPLPVGQRLSFNLPSARLVVLDDVGHCPMFEQPERCNQLVDEFLARFRAHDRWPGEDGVTVWSWSIGRRQKLDRGEWCGDGTVG